MGLPITIRTVTIRSVGGRKSDIKRSLFSDQKNLLFLQSEKLTPNLPCFPLTSPDFTVPGSGVFCCCSRYEICLRSFTGSRVVYYTIDSSSSHYLNRTTNELHTERRNQDYLRTQKILKLRPIIDNTRVKYNFLHFYTISPAKILRPEINPCRSPCSFASVRASQCF